MKKLEIKKIVQKLRSLSTEKAERYLLNKLQRNGFEGFEVFTFNELNDLKVSMYEKGIKTAEITANNLEKRKWVE